MGANRVVLTPEFRMSYPNVIEATEYKEKGKGTGKFAYNCEGIYPEDSLNKFRVLRDNQLVEVDISQLLREIALEEWPELAVPAQPGQPSALQLAFSVADGKGWPLKRGDKIADAKKAEGKDAEHYRGQRVMSCKSNVNPKVQPPVLSVMNPDGKTSRTLNRMVPSDMETAKLAFVGGNYAVAELNIVANKVSGINYLTCYLNSIRYTREGVKFGGGQGGQLMSRFEGVSGGESSHDPTAGLDSEIPF